MNRKPTLVELVEDGAVKLRLTDSDEGSLNGRTQDGRTYNGRATSALIHGSIGSIVTFYDDQKFRKGENYVRIEKKVDELVEVPLASNFVGRDDAQGEKAYYSETPEFDYIFFRKRKLDWWEKAIQDVPAGELIFSAIKAFAENSSDPRVKSAFVVVASVGKQPDENYRLDNCSSVEFAV